MNPNAPTIIHWGARQIPTSLLHLASTGFQVLEIRGHNEAELAAVLPVELAKLDRMTPVTIAPDDLVVSSVAARVVLDACRKDPDVAHCGWSNTDFISGLANVMRPVPTKPSPGCVSDYDFMRVDHVAGATTPFRVGFNGFSLLTMPAYRWVDETTRVEPCGAENGGAGCASDWRTCLRLDQAGVEIICHPTAYAAHLKIDYTRIDHRAPWKRLDLSNKTVTWIEGDA
jgi:hypothetical protein